MFQFLMVSTVLSKKQFTYVGIEENANLLHELTMISINHAKTIFFPIMNKEDVENISDLVSPKWKDAILAEIEENTIKVPFLCIKNFNNRKFSKVRRIEHVMNDMFKITSDDGNFVSNDFTPYLSYVK